MTYLFEETAVLKTVADEYIVHTVDDDEDLVDFSWGADPMDILAAKQEADQDF